MSADERLVEDPDTTMHYRYRGRVVETVRRDKVRYRGVIDQHFMGWRQWNRSRRFKTPEEAERWCHRSLDEIEHRQAASGWGAEGGRVTAPQRIQRKRTKGWKMPEGAVYVGRPTRWGNPFWHVEKFHGRARALVLYDDMAHGFWTPAHSNDLPRSPYREHHEWLKRLGVGHPFDIARSELAGRDLVCWCPLDEPCHADVLLEIANAGAGSEP